MSNGVSIGICFTGPRIKREFQRFFDVFFLEETARAKLAFGAFDIKKTGQKTCFFIRRGLYFCIYLLIKYKFRGLANESLMKKT